ncbi:helix-turn-helix domain-containing protein [Pseudomonas sp. NPDC077186]|uniref:helix-turn-helix domain-containing protein n=1 Tax=Pseudomonas TaxID=286 RepID=UPI0005BD41F7|nr:MULTISPECIES: helix-turn-helix transcriptional regulator [Pseudomonas]AYW41104.1 XRE family transcriptional regulator [Pseudomonas aeruginosa]QNH04386.1 helix-turn-helix transcriptional regulator [Pseudomonas sp. B11D7D]
MELSTAFGLALKRLRKQQGLTQEDFSNISSRTYLSSLERGIKGPTIEKVEQLASVLDLHPATILAAAYLIKENGVARRDLVLRIEAELKLFENEDYS